MVYISILYNVSDNIYDDELNEVDTFVNDLVYKYVFLVKRINNLKN